MDSPIFSLESSYDGCAELVLVCGPGARPEVLEPLGGDRVHVLVPHDEVGVLPYLDGADPVLHEDVLRARMAIQES